MALLPARLCQLPLSLRQPERHPHRAEHRDLRRQLGAGLVEAARVAVQLAEAEVAVGLEGPAQAQATSAPRPGWPLGAGRAPCGAPAPVSHDASSRRGASGPSL